MMAGLILKRAPIGSILVDFDVLEDGVIVGRIFFLSAVGPQGRSWMWASGHNGDLRCAAHGYEPGAHHRPHSSSASRLTTALCGFLLLSQSSQRPDR
jgi:hypothetical protein